MGEVASRTLDNLNLYLEHLPVSIERIRLNNELDVLQRKQVCTSPAELESSKGLDPLVAAAHHNYTHSALVRLPEELTVQIMMCLIKDGRFPNIECLRRTCRLFLRLFDSQVFASFHDTRSSTDPTHHRKICARLSDEYRPALVAGLHRDLAGYCRPCKLKRSSPRFISTPRNLLGRWIHCSACSEKHPMALFTPSNRKLGDKRRQCIGWHGRLRLCAHESVSWRQVLEAAEYLKRRHYPGDDGNDWAKAFPSGVIEIGRCRIKCHVLNHVGGGHHDFASPTASVEMTESGTVELFIRWKAHLQIETTTTKDTVTDSDKVKKNNSPGGNDSAAKTPEALTPAELGRRIGRVRQKGGVARYIAPALAPGKLPEMQCFDPHRCCCLLYRGIETLPAGARIFSSGSRDGQSQMCVSDSRLRLDCLTGQRRSDVCHGEFRIDEKAEQDAGCKEEGVVRDPKRGDRGHSVDMRFARGGGLAISVENCELDGSQCLTIFYQRSVSLFSFGGGRDHHKLWSAGTADSGINTRPGVDVDADADHWKGGMSVAWCQALDPDSYDLTSDAASEGISWCGQVDCRNYYGRLRRAMAPTASY